MSLVEIIAVLFSLVCTVLAVKKHILNWPTGIIGTAAYMILFYKEKLYADMVLQVLFITQGIYGWYSWSHKKNNTEKFSVTYLSTTQRLTYLCFIIGISTVWFLFLYNYTDGSTPYVDALAATISLTANWLMVKKKIENWLLWIIVDIIYILLFYYKGLYLSSGIYSVFLILSVKGLSDWRKINTTKEDSY